MTFNDVKELVTWMEGWEIQNDWRDQLDGWQSSGSIDSALTSLDADRCDSDCERGSTQLQEIKTIPMGI